MDTLPFDTSHPAVRDYLALIRLQVLTPLSLLLNIATVVVCTTLVTPGIASIGRLHPTSITPSAPIIGAYVGVIFLGQIGYCLLLVMARKPETKAALIKGVGLSIVFANFVMALWAVAWVMQWFLIATVLQGLLLLFLLFSNMTLLIYHQPASARPLDTALIHAPLRFFMVLPLSILFPLCLFLTLDLTFFPTPSGPPAHYSDWHAMAGFGVVLGTNLLGLAVIAIRRDIVWCVAATWIAVSIWASRPKPSPVYITAILFTALHPLALIIAVIHHHFFGKKTTTRGQVALTPDDEHPGLHPHNGRQAGHPEIERGPSEVDENTWG